MEKARMRLRLAVTAVLLFAQAGLAHAVCQIPLAIGQNTGNANVLLLLDNSGSMNERSRRARTTRTRTTAPARSVSTARTSYDVTTSGYYTPREPQRQQQQLGEHAERVPRRERSG